LLCGNFLTGGIPTRKDSKLQDSKLFLPTILPTTSASLGFLGSAGEWPSVAIAAGKTSCANTEELTMMHAEVRVLSRTRKLLKNMKKIKLVPGRGLKLREFSQPIRSVTKSHEGFTRQITRYDRLLKHAFLL
jgi:hypothetical protein